MSRIRDVRDIAEFQLCAGCGACEAVAPARYEMVDVASHGRRPRLLDPRAPGRDEALSVCPGAGLRHSTFPPEAIAGLSHAWGPVLEVWEGWAVDEELRHAASSGGAASALALYCLEVEGAHGVLHSAGEEDRPVQNETVVSTNRDELVARCGSRYAPASPCDGLGWLEDMEGSCVMIAKPCDIAAARNVADIRPTLARKLSLLIGFFCAGTPSTEGNERLLAKMGVDPRSDLRSLRYRGRGWPGRWVAESGSEEAEGEGASLSYEESWDFLQAFRPWRCRICPDHSGEFADVAVGDPWYRDISPGEAGSSLIVARTPRGRDAVIAAAAAGYLHLERSDPQLLHASQPNLYRTRGRLFGQLLAMRLLGVPRPRYEGFPAFRAWLRGLSVREKMLSVLSTVKRVFFRRLHRRSEM